MDVTSSIAMLTATACERSDEDYFAVVTRQSHGSKLVNKASYHRMSHSNSFAK